MVDDDPLVAASTAAMLEDLGHPVIEALSGARALDMLRLGAKVDVVVTDHAMPGMTGTELARQIRQHWPSLPIILATGYAELPNGEDPGLPRLAKPYRSVGAGDADRQGACRDGREGHPAGFSPSRLKRRRVSPATA